MRDQLKHYIAPLIFTLIILLILEVLGTTLFPVFGIDNYRLPFNTLIILYLGLRLESPYLAIFIVFIQYFHSLFSIEGWEMGTIAGIIVSIVIGYLKDLIHLSSIMTTILVTQLFQFIWFLVTVGLLYLKLDNFDYILDKLERFLPESLVISLLAPLFFKLFDQVWKVKEESLLGEDA